MKKYLVVEYIAGTASHDMHHVSSLREARSEAYRKAKALRPAWVTARPVWCGPMAWHESPEIARLRPVGGYDCGDGGSAVVVFA